METKEKLDKDIVEITMHIQDKFPELSKYIAEMPVHIQYTNGSNVSVEDLKKYYDSLKEVLKKYAEEHEAKKR
ncbi:MAG: hypothetical protein H7282_17730 [Cytophagaceae bacterium]|nr:hypothetical protein [Cytophagaceae bacterium]